MPVAAPSALPPATTAFCSRHDFLPLQGPVLAPRADGAGVGELGLGDLLLAYDLAGGKLGRQLDARPRRAAEVGERPGALHRRVKPPVEEFIGELLVLGADRNAGDVEDR